MTRLLLRRARSEIFKRQAALASNPPLKRPDLVAELAEDIRLAGPHWKDRAIGRMIDKEAEAPLEPIWSGFDPGTRFTHYGKQVMREGMHYADAVDEEAAAEIAAALNAR